MKENVKQWGFPSLFSKGKSVPRSEAEAENKYNKTKKTKYQVTIVERGR